MLIIYLLLVLEVWDGKPTYKKSWAKNLLMCVRFDLGPLLQGQMRIAKLKSAHNSLIIGSTGLEWQTNLQEIMGWQSFYAVRFDLGPLLQGQTRIPKLKSDYISKHFAYLVSVRVAPIDTYAPSPQSIFVSTIILCMSRFYHVPSGDTLRRDAISSSCSLPHSVPWRTFLIDFI